MDESAGDNLETIAPGVALPASALRFTFSRSGGPGGQHVNKTSTRATLTVALSDLAAVIPPWAIRRLPRRYLTDDALVISSSQSRSQSANRQNCITKLRAAVTAAMRRPHYRKPTRPTRLAQQHRLDRKKQRGQLKRSRRLNRRPPGD